MAVVVTLQFTLQDADLASGWDGNIEELKGSVRALLNEVIGDDGMPYVPVGLTIHVKSSPGS